MQGSSLSPPATPSTSPRGHLLQVWLVALILLLATYMVSDADRLRPGRVLGSVGLSIPGFGDARTPPEQAAATTDRAAESSGAGAQERAPDPPAGPASRAPDARGANAAVTATTTVTGASTAAAGASTPAVEPETRASPPPALPQRPGIAQAIEGAAHLTPFFEGLERSQRQVTRVLHYGDSTLAGDGIAKTVRLRMKERFGDGGAGFYVAGMDPRWMRRDDLRVTREGDWDIHTILFGGNNGRYGLGGVSARPKGPGAVNVTASRKGGTLGRRIEIYSHLSRSEDALRVQVNGQAAEGLQRNRLERFDRWTLDTDEDISALRLSVREPGLEIYGLVTEASQGITWETAAVVGIATGSMRQFNPEHLAAQTATRSPHLIILMLGGNETGHGGLASPEGRLYREAYLSALNTVRRGAPQAACLIMAPLDQAFQGDDGRVRSKPVMGKMVQFQREAAHQAGCAFWDSWSFMGGNGGFARWLSQGMAWTDLVHLTEKGLSRIGEALSDALMAEYELWRQHGSGTDRIGASR